MNDMYYVTDGPGWRIVTYFQEEDIHVVTIEEGYEGDTEETEHEFPYPINSELEAAGAILTLAAFAGSSGPIHGGAFPPKR